MDNDGNFIMMANGDVYYFTSMNHETHLHSLMEQYNLSYKGSDGYGLINEHEICEEHSIISSHREDVDSCNYGRNGLTEDQMNALNREIALDNIDGHFVKMLIRHIEEWRRLEEED